MHELGIVYQIMRTVEQIADENCLKAIKTVTLELGEVSGIIPDYLDECWNWASKRSDSLKGSYLDIEEIPAVTYCEGCTETYETVKHGKVCPHCKSGQTYLVTGNEMNIKEIIAE